MDDIAKYLKTLVLLQLEQQEVRRPEILLYRAGFKPKEIAEILGKKEAAVAKAISRAKATSERGTDNGE